MARISVGAAASGLVVVLLGSAGWLRAPIFEASVLVALAFVARFPPIAPRERFPGESVLPLAGRIAAAVAAALTPTHPVSLARAVMEHTEHVLLVGAGADRLAQELGLVFDDQKPGRDHVRRLARGRPQPGRKSLRKTARGGGPEYAASGPSSVLNRILCSTPK